MSSFFGRLLVILTTILCNAFADRPCIRKKYKSSDVNIVCVCNVTYCDDIEALTTIASGKAVVYTSSLAGKRLEKSIVPILESKVEADQELMVDARQKFQSIIGFGGALTDSAGINLDSLSEQTRMRLLEAYFGKNGIGYSMVRVPIASTDFSTHEYSYAETKGDMSMSEFSLVAEDYKYKIPYILSTLNMTGGNLKLFASPWSAPGWMKTNGRMKGGGALLGEVNGEYYKSYATYLTRFFEEYAKNGVKFWGMTLQNEPTSGALPFYGWQTMFMSAKMERDFVKGTLGPIFRKNDATKDLKIIALDDNRLWLPNWADKIFNDPEATKYVDGIGVHWYLNTLASPSVLTTTHERHPDKFILATEVVLPLSYSSSIFDLIFQACTGSIGVHGPILGDWYRGEEYAEDIITNMNNFVAGWVDWNMCLNGKGGPTWVNNNVDSPIIVNAAEDKFYKQPMFYAIGHFSKFVKPGSVRISAKATRKQSILTTAFSYRGRRTLVLLNMKDSSQEVLVTDSATERHILLTVDARSLTTVLWDKQ